MKITIEPTEDQRNEFYPHSTISIQYPLDGAGIETAMCIMVTALQAWGFANDSIAGFLDTDFATDRGLVKE